MSAIQGLLISIEVNGRTVRTFRIVCYIMGVCFSGVSVKRFHCITMFENQSPWFVSNLPSVIPKMHKQYSGSMSDRDHPMKVASLSGLSLPTNIVMSAYNQVCSLTNAFCDNFDKQNAFLQDLLQ